MYDLQKISDYSNCPQIQALLSDLPDKPYCMANKLNPHILVRAKNKALAYPYLQVNTPLVVRYLTFDIDDPNALFAYYDNATPRPQLIIKNPTNGHAHYIYRLRVPVSMYDTSRKHPQDYLKAVRIALAERLGADMGYNGLLAKNPLHSDWQAYITGANPQGYTLEDLAGGDPLPNPQTVAQANDDYWGRNCDTFNTIRHTAYRIADRHSETELYHAVLALAQAHNAQYSDPMQHRELHHIAKSITRFCKGVRFSGHSERSQKRRSNGGKKGSQVANAKGANSKGGKARSESYNAQREQAKNMHQSKTKIGKIAQMLGVHRNTIRRWIDE